MVQSLEDTRRRTRGASGRVPPHNLQAEQSLLGAMLLSRDAIAAAVETCGVDDFYKPAHGHVFEAVCSLYGQGEPADPVTVADELSRAGLLEAVGGLATLLSLQADTPATANAGRYGRIVEEHALLRRLIGVAGDIAEMGYSVPDDVAGVLDRAESLMFGVAERRVTDTLRPLQDLLAESLDRLEALFDRGESITGVPTGYIDLDERLSGLQPSSLVIVGARPAMGKTAFALGIAAHAAMEARTPVLVFSLEMSHAEITQRLLVSEARVDAGRIRNGRLIESDWPKINNAVGRLGEAPIHIDDDPNLTVMELRAKARRHKSRHGDLGLIIVDYLQLMSGRSSAENRQVEVSEISRGLKILARELEVPVLALSQLSRNLEMRADKRPQLADLRESGCMPASTRLMRADNGQEVTLGELVLNQKQPLVWSLDDQWKMVPRRLLKAFPSGIKPVFRMRMASGLEVEATANHRFRTIDGWKRLDELGPGDQLATPRSIRQPAQIAAWRDDEVILLAHLLGNGTMGSEVRFATADEANKMIVEQTAKRLFNIDVQGDRQKNTWQLWLPSPYHLTHGRMHPLRNWLEPLGLWKSRSYNKFIPEEMFGLSDRQLALFLHHLWATDGSITLSRNGRGPVVRAYYASTSRDLVEGVRRALMRLGIRSRLYEGRKAGYRTCWNLAICGGSELQRFLTLVGCHGKRGLVIPACLRALEGRASNPNLDLVPQEVAQRVSKAIATSRISHRELSVALGEGHCGSYPLGYPDRRRRFSRRQLKVIAEVTSDRGLGALAESEVFWDKISEITPIGSMPTFDATVEDTHNFVANGIVAHNSLEQDADVVMFLYRDEIYDSESADRGTAEVIVSKHRNGPTGTMKLAFLDHYTRFANMANV